MAKTQSEMYLQRLIELSTISHGCTAGFEHCLRACKPVGDLQGVERSAPFGSCLVARFFHREQQLFHLVGPLLLLLFVQKDQFSQMVDIAQRMQAPVEPVAAPAIMQASPAKLKQNSDRFQGFFPSFGMDRVVGQSVGGTDVSPPALAHYVHTPFILL